MERPLDFLTFLERHLSMEPEQAASLRRHCASRRRRIGTVLLERRLLNMKQLSRVLELQTERPEMRFGDLAVAEGYVRREDLEQAMKMSREHPAETIHKLELMPRDVLLDCLIAYVRALEEP